MEGIKMVEKDRIYHLTTVIFFILAAAVHIMGYFTNYFYAVGWLMWVPALVLSVIVIIRIIKEKYIINRHMNKKKIYVSTQFIVLAISFVYVIFNIIYNCYILRNGGGEYKDGVYWLINLGERIREISAEEYGRLLLAEYRMFTGHILFFYALIVMFFKERMMEDEAVSQKK